MKKIHGIKVSQPLGDFFIAKIKARDLLEISTSSVARYNKEGRLVGNQRPLKLPRLKAIANFIKSAEMSFPTSILVAANVDYEGNIIGSIKKMEYLSNICSGLL
ncbi:ParB N-terminal domain-containing protein [Alistipes onderdonkii]|uniref:hypothetical protein n=1 Tax=Alistipes onderdonkii TaxID=328813 RepID=UPI00050A0CCC|nr:hypothetical protein [Alistipes onderdonkii]